MERLDPKTIIAIHAGSKIGDSLISMVFARNLRENGYDVTIFSDPLMALAPLFPSYAIQPAFTDQEREEKLAPFDLRLYPANGDYLRHKDPKIERLLLEKSRPIFHCQERLADVFEKLCKEVFGLKKAYRDPGMLPPAGIYKKHKRRIAIHPTSSREDKNWQKSKFLRVAQALKDQGFEPVFVLAPHEAPAWEGCGFPLAYFSSLLDMASFLYESDLFFGNDSGLGHLASAMHQTTVTLCPRKKQGRRWGPAWGKSEILYPWLHLPGLRMKELFWKYFISPQRALGVLLAQRYE